MKLFLSACLFFSALILSAQPQLKLIVGSTEYTTGSLSYDAGEVFINYPLDISFAVANPGDLELEFDFPGTIVLSGAEADQFEVGSTPWYLAPGDKDELVIRFNPTSPGTKTAVVTINSNIADFTFSITGTALATPASCTIPAFDFENFQNASSLKADFGTITGTALYTIPTGWQADESIINARFFDEDIHVRSTTDKNSGTYALEFFNDATPGEADALTIVNCENLYTSVKGFYKFTGAASDFVEITVSTGGADFSDQTATNTNTLEINADAATYTAFEIPIEYDASSTHKIFIHIRMSNYGTATSFKLDDLTLHGVLPDAPPQKPATPYLTASGQTSAKLNWVAPFDNGSSITSYTLQQKTEPAGSYSPIYTGADLNFTATGLTNGTTYSFRVSATNSVDNSVFSEAIEFTAGSIVTMANGTLTTCNTVFKDSQGALPYNFEEDQTLTFVPAENGKKIKITFSEFGTESGWDELFVFNGPNTGSTSLGTFSGSTLPGEMYGTSTGGELTFRFTSDDIFNYEGWVATVSCYTPGPPDKPNPVTFATVTPTSVQANWLAPATNGSPITNYVLERKQGAGGIYEQVYSGTGLTHTSTNLTLGQTYFFRVKATNSMGPSSYSDESEVTTRISMINGTQSVCGGTFTDTGGPTGDYNHNEDITLTIEPSTPGKKVRVTFASFDTEDSYDFLSVYNGSNTSNPIDEYTGTSLPGTITSSSTDGALTFRFVSDHSVAYEGWVATVSCVAVPSKPAAVTFTNIQPTSTTVNWIAPDNNGSPITGYSLEKKEGTGGSFAQVYTGTNLSFNATSLTAGTTYFFRVKAINAIGDSEFSDASSVIPNSAPVLATNTGLTLAEGGTASVTQTILNTTDAEHTASQISYKVTVLPSHGNLKKNGANIPVNGTFTQQDIIDNKVEYQNNGDESATDSFKFIVSDGVASLSQATFSIVVNPINDAPVVQTNTGATVLVPSTYTLSDAQLKTIDPDNNLTSIVYTVTTLPTKGTLRVNGVPLAAQGTFTQQDIVASLVNYEVESGTGTDSFIFNVTDGTVTISNTTFVLTLTPNNTPPTVATNNGLTLPEGGNKSLRTHLATTDPDQNASQIIYTVVTIPQNGQLRRGGNSLALNTQFTQSNIDDDLIEYVHNGGETTSDLFKFTVTDGIVTSAETTFTITVTPVNDAPVSTKVKLQLEEGSEKVIDEISLVVSDNDNGVNEIIYRLTRLPQHGVLKLNGATIAVEGTFSQADLNNNKVKYQHDGTSSTSDSFAFSVSDGTTTLPEQTFEIEIAPAPLVSQSITFAALPNKTEGDAPFALSATATSGLPVSFVVVSGPATLSGNTLTLTGVGPIVIKASQPGDDDFHPASDVQQSFCANPRKPTISQRNDGALSSSASSGNQWYQDGNAINGATSSTLTINEPDSYQVKVTVNGCSSDLSTTFIAVITGDILTNTPFDLYPNPAQAELSVTGMTSAVKAITSITITGQLMEMSFRQESNLVKVDVSRLASGIYFLNIETTDKNIRLKFAKN